MLARKIVAALVLCCAACSSLLPAATPPQLRREPADFISLSETRFDAGAFTLDYPSSWRVVKLNSADAPLLRLAFVAPDESALLLTQLGESDPAPQNGGIVRLAPDRALHYALTASDDAAESFMPHARRIIASIRG